MGKDVDLSKAVDLGGATSAPADKPTEAQLAMWSQFVRAGGQPTAAEWLAMPQSLCNHLVREAKKVRDEEAQTLALAIGHVLMRMQGAPSSAESPEAHAARVALAEAAGRTT